MNEQQLEALEKLFPDGFVVYYVDKEGYPHRYISNPQEEEHFEQVANLIDTQMDKADEEQKRVDNEGEEWKNGAGSQPL